MELVQLIEKVRMKNGLWVTFWALDKKMRLSMEIRNPARKYQVGEIYQLDKHAHHEFTALQTDFDIAQLDYLDLPVAVSNMKKLRQRLAHRMRRFTYIPPYERADGEMAPEAANLGGMVSLSDEQHTLAN